MKKVKWNKLAKRIPKSFKVNRTNFKVNWVDKFDDGKHVGLSDWNNNCIYIKRKQSKEELVKTYIHECLHIFSDEYDISLTENQISLLEKTLQYWLLSGNIFSKDKK